MKNLETKARAYALKNALAHDGKAQQGAIISGLFAEGLEKNKVKETMPIISKVLKEVNSLSLEKQKKEFEKFKDETSE